MTFHTCQNLHVSAVMPSIELSTASEEEMGVDCEGTLGVCGIIMETCEGVMGMGDDTTVTCEVGIMPDDGVGNGEVNSVNTNKQLLKCYMYHLYTYY